MTYTAKQYSNCTYFIFRDDGKEIEFSIIDGIIKVVNNKLTIAEINFIRENLL